MFHPLFHSLWWEQCICCFVVWWPEYARRSCRLRFVVSRSLTTITADAAARSTSWEERWEILAAFGERARGRRTWEQTKEWHETFMILCRKNRSLLQLIATENINSPVKCDLNTNLASLGVYVHRKRTFVMSAGPWEALRQLENNFFIYISSFILCSVTVRFNYDLLRVCRWKLAWS